MKKITIIIFSLLLVLILVGCDDTSELILIENEDIIEDKIVTDEEVVLDENINIEAELVLLADLTWGASVALSSSNLTIEDMLLYAIQDEYSAQAEYAYILENFEITKPFSNIIIAEGSHIEMLLPLFSTYEIYVPENTSNDHLIEIESIYEAFETGVYAEIINIAMYNTFLEYDLPDDIETVFISLRDASMNHLEAFEKNLAKLQ